MPLKLTEQYAVIDESINRAWLDMKKAAEMAQRISYILPDVKVGTLRFFGDWFGRPYDNCHTIKSAQVTDNCLIITFDEQETLSIWNPSGARVSKDEFQIDYASRVFWQWYYYGRPQIPENLYYQDYLVEGSEIKATTNSDWHKPNLQPSISEPAIKIY